MSTSNQTARPDASIVPIEGPAQSASAPSAANGFRTAGVSPAPLTSAASASPFASNSAPFGANNEQLPERLQSALRRIVQQFGTESESTRRQEIRRIKQAHQFWRGLQYSGGASATRTGTSPSNKNSPTARPSKICRATNSSPISTRPSASRSSACFRRTCRASAFSPPPHRPKKMSPPRKPPRKRRS
jgi:hypothetical protein